jgi:hypothetical protein
MPKREVVVEAFLDRLSHPRRLDIDRVRSIVSQAIPAATEHIKWNAPSWVVGGVDRLTMRLQPGARVQLILHRGPKPSVADGFSFEDPWGLLEWAASDRAVVTFLSSEDLDAKAEALADTVRRWATTPVPVDV